MQLESILLDKYITVSDCSILPRAGWRAPGPRAPSACVRGLGRGLAAFKGPVNACLEHFCSI